MNAELQAILESKGLWNRIIVDELDKKIAGEVPAREIVFLCSMGRLVKNANYSSFNLLVNSSSSAGKDYITKSVLELFSHDEVYTKTRISEKVLNYWTPFKRFGKESWNGNILYLTDVSDYLLNCEALKVMCSEGSNITIMEKVQGKLTPVDVSIEGKPVIICTTANSVPNEETLNRFIIVKLDESESQTRRIHEFTTKIHQEGRVPEYDQKIIEALQQLQPHKVSIPFLDQITPHFPVHLLRMRRLFNTFIDLIKSVAIVHQYRRSFNGESLVAELEDYDLAKDVFMNLCFDLSDVPLNRRIKDIVKVLKDKKSDEPLSASEIQPSVQNHISLAKIRPHLDSAVNMHILSKFYSKGTFGQELIKYDLSEDYTTELRFNLPHGVDLEKPKADIIVKGGDVTTNSSNSLTY